MLEKEGKNWLVSFVQHLVRKVQTSFTVSPGKQKYFVNTCTDAEHKEFLYYRVFMLNSVPLGAEMYLHIKESKLDNVKTAAN